VFSFNEPNGPSAPERGSPTSRSFAGSFNTRRQMTVGGKGAGKVCSPSTLACNSMILAPTLPLQDHSIPAFRGVMSVRHKDNALRGCDERTVRVDGVALCVHTAMKTARLVTIVV
jgi:hypothetical protein